MTKKNFLTKPFMLVAFMAAACGVPSQTQAVGQLDARVLAAIAGITTTCVSSYFIAACPERNTSCEVVQFETCGDDVTQLRYQSGVRPHAGPDNYSGSNARKKKIAQTVLPYVPCLGLLIAYSNFMQKCCAKTSGLKKACKAASIGGVTALVTYLSALCLVE